MLIPHPSFAHPSPSMGGELVTTAGLFDPTPASLTPPLQWEGRWLPLACSTPPQLRSPLPFNRRGVCYHRWLVRLHPSFAHPSPSMGGELVTTAGLFDSTPASLAPPLQWEGS
jgi:hypothetical protein